MWPLEYAGKGERALVVFRADVKLAGQSTAFEQHHGAVVTVREGRIARVELYLRAEDARAAFDRL